MRIYIQIYKLAVSQIHVSSPHFFNIFYFNFHDYLISIKYQIWISWLHLEKVPNLSKFNLEMYQIYPNHINFGSFLDTRGTSTFFYYFLFWISWLSNLGKVPNLNFIITPWECTKSFQIRLGKVQNPPFLTSGRDKILTTFSYLEKGQNPHFDSGVYIWELHTNI